MKAFVGKTENVITDLFGVQTVVSFIQLFKGSAEKPFSPLHPLVDIIASQPFTKALFKDSLKNNLYKIIKPDIHYECLQNNNLLPN